MSTSPKTVFLLGASGFIGAHTLQQLAKDLPLFPVIALVRDVTQAKSEALKALHPNVQIIQGDLNDTSLIKEWASKCPIVVNVASSDHPASAFATLEGLTLNAAKNPTDPPIYIHMSGIAVTSDNTRGEPVPASSLQVWSDLEFHPSKVSRTNVHMDLDLAVCEAGERTEDRIRTAIVYPGWVYGRGIGPQQTTFGLRIFQNLFPSVGHAGTWGPGANQLTSVHVEDVATAITAILKGLLDGKADEGKDGYYFVVSEQPFFTMHDFKAAFGDDLFKRGKVKEPGSKPLPPAVTDQMGELVWSSLGGNQLGKAERLRKLGWEPVVSRKLSLFESLPKELDIAFQATHASETSSGETKAQGEEVLSSILEGKLRSADSKNAHD